MSFTSSKIFDALSLGRSEYPEEAKTNLEQSNILFIFDPYMIHVHFVINPS
jgi:hypothetical protein